MKILLIDNGTILLEELKLLISEEEIVHKYDDLKNLNYNDFDLIILSGSSGFKIIGNENRLKDEIEIIKNTNKPIIGICYGCELIAESFGGELEKMEIQDEGVNEVEVVSDNMIFGNLKTFKVYENHSWKIKTVPADFIVLAKSEKSIEIIKHKDKDIYGFQFHPEHFQDKTEGDEIFLNLFNSIKNC